MATTADPDNIALFGRLAADWWDPDGSSRLLHRLNPVRLGFIRESLAAHFGLDLRRRRLLDGLKGLDIGCGGGLVTEPLARMGAAMTGIDGGEAVIEVARAHAAGQGLAIDYRAAEVSTLADRAEVRFDFITCLEVIEHISDVEVFLVSVAALLKPGGMFLFSTPNRTPLSWAVLIAGAEKIARLIPEGGHDWRQFLTPDELTQKLAATGLVVDRLKGLTWSPLRGFGIAEDLRVNYIGTARKKEQAA
jgi:2-polyprenyl-6-hydroxyphenyl methylase/3-demethylubiquinone-9 3-methyltransferase